METPPPPPAPPPPAPQPSAPPPPAPGRRVGPFILTGATPIGRGSFADVWAGTDTRSGRPVAVKAIHTTRLSPKLREGLASEVACLRAASGHAHVVELLDVVDDAPAQCMFLVMEFCAGGDVAALLRATPGGRLPEAAARRLGGHLAAGLRRLWSAGCVHRDLKPHNLLLSLGGGDEGGDGGGGATAKPAATSSSALLDRVTLKIADFGFARSLAPAALADTLCGSPLYMAPEVLRHGRYGASADLWSVGAILFELVAGAPPFSGTTQAGLLAAIDGAAGGARLPPGVQASPDLVSLLGGLLVPDPAARLSFEAFFAHPWLAGAPGLQGADKACPPPPALPPWLPPPAPPAPPPAPLLGGAGLRPALAGGGGITARGATARPPARGGGGGGGGGGGAGPEQLSEDGFVLVAGGGGTGPEALPHAHPHTRRGARAVVALAVGATAARLARRSPQPAAPLAPPPPLPPPAPPPPQAWPPGTPAADALLRTAAALDGAAAEEEASGPAGRLSLRLAALTALAAVVGGRCPGAEAPATRARAAAQAAVLADRAAVDAAGAASPCPKPLPPPGGLAYRAALASARAGAAAAAAGEPAAAAAYDRARALFAACVDRGLCAVPAAQAAAAAELGALVGDVLLEV